MNQIVPMKTMVGEPEKEEDQDFDVEISDHEMKDAILERQLSEPMKQM